MLPNSNHKSSNLFLTEQTFFKSYSTTASNHTDFIVANTNNYDNDRSCLSFSFTVQ